MNEIIVESTPEDMRQTVQVCPPPTEEGWYAIECYYGSITIVYVSIHPLENYRGDFIRGTVRTFVRSLSAGKKEWFSMPIVRWAKIDLSEFEKATND